MTWTSTCGHITVLCVWSHGALQECGHKDLAVDTILEPRAVDTKGISRAVVTAAAPGVDTATRIPDIA